MGVEEDRPRGPQDPHDIPTGKFGVQAVANDRFQLGIDRRSVVEFAVPMYQLGESLLICHDIHVLILLILMLYQPSVFSGPRWAEFLAPPCRPALGSDPFRVRNPLLLFLSRIHRPGRSFRREKHARSSAGRTSGSSRTVPATIPLRSPWRSSSMRRGLRSHLASPCKGLRPSQNLCLSPGPTGRPSLETGYRAR